MTSSIEAIRKEVAELVGLAEELSDYYYLRESTSSVSIRFLEALAKLKDKGAE